jgi:hypothetical protein
MACIRLEFMIYICNSRYCPLSNCRITFIPWAFNISNSTCWPNVNCASHMKTESQNIVLMRIMCYSMAIHTITTSFSVKSVAYKPLL